MTRTRVYIDGFNYYGSVRGTPFRWLNFEDLVTRSFVAMRSTRLGTSPLGWMTVPATRVSRNGRTPTFRP